MGFSEPLPGLSELQGILFQYMPEDELAAIKGIQMPMVTQELEGFYVGWQVVLANSTKGCQPREEQGPNGFCSVLMNLTSDILALTMVNTLMMVAKLLQEVVALGRICVDGASRGNGSGHNWLQTLSLHIRHHIQHYLTLLPPNHGDHSRAVLGGTPPSPPSLLGPSPRGEKGVLWHHRQEPDPYGLR